MNNEEFERTKSFIIGQQAQFALDLQLLQEAQARTELVVARNAEALDRTSQLAEKTLEAVGQTTEVVGQTVEVVGRLAEATARHAEATREGFNDVNGKINALIDSQMRTDEKFAELADSQKLTDESVRNLAATVDRHIKQGRNGERN